MFISFFNILLIYGFMRSGIKFVDMIKLTEAYVQDQEITFSVSLFYQYMYFDSKWQPLLFQV